MNILIANTQEFNPLIGGVERVSALLAQDFVEQGNNVFFLAYYKSPFSKEYNSVVPQFFLPNSKDIAGDENESFLLDLIKEKKIDIILNQAGNILNFSELCINVKKKSNVKLISALHINPDFNIKQLEINAKVTINNFYSLKLIRRNILFLYRRYKLIKFYTSFYTKLYHFSDKVVLLSEKYIPIYKKFLQSEDDSKLLSIPNPNTLFLDAQEELSKQKTIIYVGRLDFLHKRTDRIIKVWSKIENQFPDWKLKIIGNGPYLDDLKKMTTSLNLKNVEFLGFVEPVKFYKAASILCMTSNIEGWPLVLNEALSFGVVPFAFSSFESVYDIIENNKNGYIISPFNLDDYTKKMTDLMKDDEKLTKMSKRAIVSSNRFSKDVITTKWTELFEKVL